MALEVGGVEIHLAEVAVRIALRLIEKMPRGRIAALTTHTDGPSLQLRAEFDRCDEAVAFIAVVTLGSGVAFCAEGCEGAPLRGGEGDRDAGLRVAEGLHQGAVVP